MPSDTPENDANICDETQTLFLEFDLLSLVEDPEQFEAIYDTLVEEISKQMHQQTDYFVPHFYNRLTGHPVHDDDSIIPTPPLSPSMNLEGGNIDPLSFMVNPDKVLFQPFQPKTATAYDNPLLCKSENFGGDISPFSEDDDLNDELSYDHLFEDNDEDSKCLDAAEWWNDSKVYGFSFDNRINATIPPPNEVHSSISTSNVTTAPRQAPESYSSRTRLFSGIFDPYSSDSAPLFEQIDAIELNFDTINCRPDTPAESSDAAESTDAEDDELKRRVNNVLLEHNYHFPYSKKPITPKKEQLPQTQIGSDDEVDVESYEENILNRVCRLANISSPEEIMNLKDFPDVGATVTIEPVKPKRGKRSNSPAAPRKVGRPPKNVKRLHSCNNLKGLVVQKPNCRPISMDPDKRSLHNRLERMRRVTLKDSFDQVRLRVPSLIDKPKAPKVLILSTAASYISSLAEELDRDCIEISRLTRIRDLLNQQLYFSKFNRSP